MVLTTVYQNEIDSIKPFESMGVRCESPLNRVSALEAEMFARHVSMVPKPDCTAQFARPIKNEIVPPPRKQKGFKDEITFVAPDGTEAICTTLWDQKGNAPAYYRTAYPQVPELLARVVEGTTEVKTLEVSYSTYHKIAARAATAS
jgi:hypothetical protein